MHNGRIRISYLRYSQALHCWTCHRRGGGLVVEKGVRRYVEAGIESHRSVRIPQHTTPLNDLTPLACRPMDVDRGLSIVATSEDSTEFAHMSLMKDELVLDVGTDEARKSMDACYTQMAAHEEMIRDY